MANMEVHEFDDGGDDSIQQLQQPDLNVICDNIVSNDSDEILFRNISFTGETDNGVEPELRTESKLKILY